MGLIQGSEADGHHPSLRQTRKSQNHQGQPAAARARLRSPRIGSIIARHHRAQLRAPALRGRAQAALRARVLGAASREKTAAQRIVPAREPQRDGRAAGPDAGAAAAARHARRAARRSSPVSGRRTSCSARRRGRAGAVSSLPSQDLSLGDLTPAARCADASGRRSRRQARACSNRCSRRTARARSSCRPMLPVQAGWHSSNYGWRIDPFSGQRAFHEGIDFLAEQGTAIHAAAGGVVVYSDFHPQYGNMIEIDHGNDLVSRYAHASKLSGEGRRRGFERRQDRRSRQDRARDGNTSAFRGPAPRRAAESDAVSAAARLKSESSTNTGWGVSPPFFYELASRHCPGPSQLMIQGVLKKIFGSRNERLLKQYGRTVREINALEPEISQLSDDAAAREDRRVPQAHPGAHRRQSPRAARRTSRRRRRGTAVERAGRRADDDTPSTARAAKRSTKILPEAFAVVREAGKRVLNMRHFDVQLDRRHRASQRQDRRDAHGRRQDARRDAARVPQCARRRRRAHRHRQRLPRAARRRLDGTRSTASSG